MHPRIFAGCLLTMVAPLLAAQDLPPALLACRAEQDDAKRLACYDRHLDAQPRPSAVAIQDAAPPADTVAAAQERFGMESELARSEREQAREVGRELDELHSTVAQLASRPDGTLIITLENGQVWAPREYHPTFSLKVGDPVRIRRGAVGSYVLNATSNRSTRVKRLR